MRFLTDLPSRLAERRFRRATAPRIFTDWLNHRYWQHPGDRIRDALRHGSVVDSTRVVKYILRTVRPGWSCVDIGASIGGISVPLWKQASPGGSVLSVEADPAVIERLKANLSLNDCPQDQVVNVAVTDRKGIVQLRCFPECNGWQTIGDPSVARGYRFVLVDVPSLSFAELAAERGMARMNLVKIDVEGAEPKVFQGMRVMLSQKRIERVIFEVNWTTLEGTGAAVSDLFSFWSGLDYRLWRLDDDGAPALLQGEWPRRTIGDCLATSSGIVP
jgi:FkbM family methyltransferase